MHVGVAGGSGGLLDSGLVDLVGVDGSSVAVDDVSDGRSTVGRYSGVSLPVLVTVTAAVESFVMVMRPAPELEAVIGPPLLVMAMRPAPD